MSGYTSIDRQLALHLLVVTAGVGLYYLLLNVQIWGLNQAVTDTPTFDSQLGYSIMLGALLTGNATMLGLILIYPIYVLRRTIADIFLRGSDRWLAWLPLAWLGLLIIAAALGIILGLADGNAYRQFLTLAAEGLSQESATGALVQAAMLTAFMGFLTYCLARAIGNYSLLLQGIVCALAIALVSYQFAYSTQMLFVPKGLGGWAFFPQEWLFVRMNEDAATLDAAFRNSQKLSPWANDDNFAGVGGHFSSSTLWLFYIDRAADIVLFGLPSTFGWRLSEIEHSRSNPFLSGFVAWHQLIVLIAYAPLVLRVLVPFLGRPQGTTGR